MELDDWLIVITTEGPPPEYDGEYQVPSSERPKNHSHESVSVVESMN